MKTHRPVLIYGLAIVVAVVFISEVLYPISVLGVRSALVDGNISFERFRSLLDPSNAGNMEAVRNSVIVSVLSILLSGIIGTFFAFVFSQMDFPLKRLLSRLAILPIALPPLVGVIAFLFVFGQTGILPRFLQRMLGSATVPVSLDGLGAILTVHVYSFYVYYYLFVSDSLRTIDGSLIEASINLGATPWRIFRSVVLPHLRPALLAASALTFMASMASFSAPLVFAGRHRFITLQIYYTKLNGDMDLAATQSLLLLLLSAVFFVVLTFARGKEIGSRQMKGATRSRSLQVGRRTRAVCVSITWVLMALCVLPLLAIVLISLSKDGTWTTQLLPPVYTPENFIRLFDDPHVLEPIRNSFLMASVTTVAALGMGVTASYLLTKTQFRRFRVAGDLLLTLPYAIPGTVVALALILAFGRPVLASAYSILVGTFWILPLAYFIRMYPLVIRSTTAALSQFDDSLLEAAETFGAGPFKRFRTIIAPLILPSVVSAGLLVFITALGEFVSSILLYTYSNRPVSVEILAQLRMFNLGGAAAYSVVLLILIMAATWIAGRLSGPSSEGSLPLQS